MFAFSSLLIVIAGSTLVYASGGINSGKPVPYIQNDAASAEFLAGRVEKDYGGKEERWLPFARKLAKTLSQLTATEQSEVWYGQ